MLRRGNPIVVDAIEEGVVLYESNKFSEIRKIYQELKKRGLRRTKTSIIIPHGDPGEDK